MVLMLVDDGYGSTLYDKGCLQCRRKKKRESKKRRKENERKTTLYLSSYHFTAQIYCNATRKLVFQWFNLLSNHHKCDTPEHEASPPSQAVSSQVLIPADQGYPLALERGKWGGAEWAEDNWGGNKEGRWADQAWEESEFRGSSIY